MPDTFNWVGSQHAQFQGLLSDIRTHPEDINLRLILADWLVEHADLLPGDEAESAVAWSRLLHLQCDREQSRTHLSLEERQLLSRYRSRWLDALAAEAVTVEWRLGFLILSGTITALHAVVRDCDESIFTRVLWLRPHGSGQSRGRHLEALLDLPQLGGLGVLDLSMLTHLGSSTARALARAPHLSELRHLHARGVGFEADEFAHLASSPYLALQSLDLGYNAGGDVGAIALAESPAMGSLQTLRLQRIALTDDGAAALLESPHLANLQELSLYGNRDLSPDMAGRLEERFGLGFNW